MINFITIIILKFFDFFHQKKIINFIKKQNINHIVNFVDIGSHKGESINLFLNNFKIDNIYAFEPSPINYNFLKKYLPKKGSMLDVGSSVGMMMKPFMKEVYFQVWGIKKYF